MSTEEQEKKKAMEAAKPFTLPNLLYNSLQNEDGGDVVFAVANQAHDERVEIPAHRAVLAAVSPVFESMFMPLDKDNKISSRPKIPITGIDPESVRKSIEALYQDDYRIVLDAPIAGTSEFARRYQIDKLLAMAKTACTTGLTLGSALSILESSPQVFGEVVGLAYVLENAEDLLQHESFLTISRATLEMLAAQDELSVDEVSLLQALNRWAQFNYPSGKSKEGASLPASETAEGVFVELSKYVRYTYIDLVQMGELARLNLLPSSMMVKLFELEAECRSSSGTTRSPKVKEMCQSLGIVDRERHGAVTFESSILTTRQLKKDFGSLFSDRPGGSCGAKFTRVLTKKQATGNSAYHTACDNKGPTVVIIKTTSNHIFGGYVGVNMVSNSNYQTVPAFIFSLVNPRNKIVKLYPNGSNSIYCQTTYGPTFGSGHDIYVSGNLASGSCSPSTYTTPAPGYPTGVDSSQFNSGSSFTVADIEAFTVQWKPGKKPAKE